MDVNPYESPQALPPPQPDKGRALRWLGTFLMVFAIVPYVPMTIGPFVALATDKNVPRLVFLAGIFNGCVCAALFFGGRWLRRKGRRPPAEELQSQEALTASTNQNA